MAFRFLGTRAWQAQMVAMPFSPVRCTFYKQRAWQPYKPVTPLSSRNLKANYHGFQMILIYHLFLYYFKFLIYRVKCKILPMPNPSNMVPSVRVWLSICFLPQQLLNMREVGQIQWLWMFDLCSIHHIFIR